MNFIKEYKIQEVCLPIAAALDTDENSDRIDMANWDGVVFITPITDSDATGVAAITGEQDALDADAAMSALTGAIATAACVTGDDLNDKLLVLEIYRPTKRYVQIAITSTEANIAFGTTIAILYKDRKFPITQPATVLHAVAVVSPTEVA